jgi:hypothetical protein
MLHGLWLDLFLRPEDGFEISAETSIEFQRTTRRHIPEDVSILSVVVSLKASLFFVEVPHAPLTGLSSCRTRVMRE